MTHQKHCCTFGSAGSGLYVGAGQIRQIATIDVYDTSPNEREGAQIILLLLPDGFGLAKHNIMLADALAQSGWHVLVPDYFEGDPLPISILRDGMKVVDSTDSTTEPSAATFNIATWLQKHNHERVRMILKEMLKSLRLDDSAAVFYGVGYCFGGKHVLRLAQHDLKAALAFHPSFIEEPDVRDVQVPLFVGLGENDDMVPQTLAQDIQTWKGSAIGRKESPFQMKIYPGMKHGFAARPDTTNSDIFEQYQRALNDTTEFLAQYR